MHEKQHFTSVHFKNYKAFTDFSASLREFNVLVGPNNSGKSTILGAFRLLSEGIRKASSRNPEYLKDFKGATRLGYRVSLKDVPIATENIFTNYDESKPATIHFRTSGGNSLTLYFPEQDSCLMFCDSEKREISSTAAFNKLFDIKIGFVPILGPVEHHENLFQQEAARLALLTHTASRNFRNIWYHYREGFEKFRELIRVSWPGMDIEPPEIDRSHEKPRIHMFCPEERFPREIFWAGFGFQVWCQMLTFIVKNVDSSILIIDEPDIYLHSDLQCQLVGILRELGPDILIATHSTEIISEVEPECLLAVNKNNRSARRIKDATQLQQVFSILGSNLNPTISQLAKSRRVLFVEGKDFRILSLFARKLGKIKSANRADFAVVPLEGFNVEKITDFLLGMQITLGMRLLSGVILDRDYRSDLEIKEILHGLSKHTHFAIIHNSKEIENYLLHPEAIERSIRIRIADRLTRERETTDFSETVEDILMGVSDPFKSSVIAQCLSRRIPFEKVLHSNLDATTITATILQELEISWQKWKTRVNLVSGKQTLSALNAYLQEKYKISISPALIIASLKREEIPDGILDIISKLENLRTTEVPDS
jgi:energy-coupling factor transporter ATP-binding protein EcfA2